MVPAAVSVKHQHTCLPPNPRILPSVARLTAWYQETGMRAFGHNKDTEKMDSKNAPSATTEVPRDETTLVSFSAEDVPVKAVTVYCGDKAEVTRVVHFSSPSSVGRHEVGLSGLVENIALIKLEVYHSVIDDIQQSSRTPTPIEHQDSTLSTSFRRKAPGCSCLRTPISLTGTSIHKADYLSDVPSKAKEIGPRRSQRCLVVAFFNNEKWQISRKRSSDRFYRLCFFAKGLSLSRTPPNNRAQTAEKASLEGHHEETANQAEYSPWDTNRG